jgi:cyclopropane fatty-acyl-phospholipid synthase-like methyltransferase
MSTKTVAWFKTWFDTKYYHILYKNRNDEEAQLFMRNLIAFLKLNKEAKILDLACGKGRHSVYLNSLGYNVVGLDLAKNSIKHASQFENETLKFGVHDMREVYPEKFEAVFNLFTSFGYFNDDNDNLKTIQAVYNELNSGGVAVFDFLNATKAKSNLQAVEAKEVDGITFHLTRRTDDKYIYKTIDFEDNDEQFSYNEQVRCLGLADFEAYFEQAGFSLENVFGDYDLSSFDVAKSNRMIMLVRK